MSRKYDLIVFDWDGTLCDSTPLIVRSIQQACADVGLSRPEDRRAAFVIGMGLEAAMQYLAPDRSVDLYLELSERYRHHYFQQEHTVRLFAGAEQLLGALRSSDYRLAVATGKSRRGLNASLQLTGTREYFHETRTADETEPKPHPRMLQELIAAVATTPDRTLMIGDTTHDLQLAVNAGVDALAVSYGAHDEDLLSQEQALAVLPTLDQLTRWFDQQFLAG